MVIDNFGLGWFWLWCWWGDMSMNDINKYTHWKKYLNEYFGVGCVGGLMGG